ncbi:MAG: hypothetical protein ACREVN_01965 [Gammaproteobacteria bacterium]
MKLFVSAALLAAGVVGLSGCASQAESSLASGPKFTEEEKAAMSEEEKLALYNAQVEEEERLRCTQIKRTGSHRMTRVCTSADERRADQEAAQEALRRSRNAPAPTGD